MCLVYARSGTSYSMYTFMSRWLPKTLCHNVCGISSEPVTAVAVYSQHSVPALIWHLLWTFLLLWQRTERSNIHWTSGMCCEILGLSYTDCQEYLDYSEPSCCGKELKEVILTEHQECVAKPLCLSYTHCKEYLEYAIWLSEFFSMVWNPFYIKMYWKWANGGQEHGMPDEHLECNRTALIASSSSQSNMGMVCWRLASVSKQACGGSSDHSSLAGTLLRVTLRFARDSNLETTRVITIRLRCCSQNQRAPVVMRPQS